MVLTELVAVLPLPYGLSTFLVFLPLVAVYYWSVYTPRFMSMPITLLLGLTFDLMTSGMLGLYVLLFFTAQAMVEQQRGFLAEGSFMTLWGGFGFCATIAVGVAHIAAGLKAGVFPPPKAVVYPLLAVVAMFPLWASAFTPLLKLLPKETN